MARFDIAHDLTPLTATEIDGLAHLHEIDCEPEVAALLSASDTDERRHFTAYVGEIKALRRAGRDDEAERILLDLLDVIEREAHADGVGVAPWYYEQLALIYAKQKRRAAEIAVLERFARQPHAPGVKPARLRARLNKLLTSKE